MGKKLVARKFLLCYTCRFSRQRESLPTGVLPFIIWFKGETDRRRPAS